MRAVIYARYSEGPRQTDQSIEGQVADCTAYAASKGISVLDVYADRHISGKSVEGRDAFQQMIRDAEKHLFDAVIVWKVDRFGRSREDIAVNKRRLKKAGVVLLYAKESVPDGPEGILLESLLEGLAEYYSADLRQKVTRGIRESVKKGKYVTGSLPPGYRKDADGRVQVDPENADTIRELFRMHIGGASQKELLGFLVRSGLKTRSGGLPGKTLVYRILRNRKYTGVFDVGEIEMRVEPIIDKETFEEAQRRFKGSRGNAAGKAKEGYLLSCRCTCSVCGKLLSGDSGTGKSGKTYYYYRCRTKGCPTGAIKKDQLEELVLKHTIEDVLRDDIIEKLVARIMEIQEAEPDPSQGLRSRLADVRKKQDNLTASLEYGPSRAVSARLAELEKEERALQEQIDAAALQRVIIPEHLVRGWLLSFRSGDVTDPAFRQRLVDSFVAQVFVGPEQITIAYNATDVQKRTVPKCSDTVQIVKLLGRYPNTCGAPALLDRWILITFPRPL